MYDFLVSKLFALNDFIICELPNLQHAVLNEVTSVIHLTIIGLSFCNKY